MRVHIYNKQSVVQFPSSDVRKLVKSFLSFSKTHTNEISIHFVDIETISRLHGEFFDDPSSTDCITFPMDPPSSEKPSEEHILGEVFVCPEVAYDYAQLHGGDPKQELTLYILHCLLHLLGFDDIEDQDAIIMRAKEHEAINFVKENSFFPAFDFHVHNP